MQILGKVAVVTGGASGLGLATMQRLVGLGARVVIADLPTSAGESVAREMGGSAHFVAADVTSESQMNAVFDTAESLGSLRAVVHCAGRGGPLRVLDKDGMPVSLDIYEGVIRVNLIGSFNVLRLGAARLAKVGPIDGER